MITEGPKNYEECRNKFKSTLFFTCIYFSNQIFLNSFRFSSVVADYSFYALTTTINNSWYEWERVSAYPAPVPHHTCSLSSTGLPAVAMGGCGCGLLCGPSACRWTGPQPPQGYRQKASKRKDLFGVFHPPVGAVHGWSACRQLSCLDGPHGGHLETAPNRPKGPFWTHSTSPQESGIEANFSFVATPDKGKYIASIC